MGVKTVLDRASPRPAPCWEKLVGWGRELSPVPEALAPEPNKAAHMSKPASDSGCGEILRSADLPSDSTTADPPASSSALKEMFAVVKAVSAAWVAPSASAEEATDTIHGSGTQMEADDLSPPQPWNSNQRHRSLGGTKGLKQAFGIWVWEALFINVDLWAWYPKACHRHLPQMKY